MFKAHSNKQDQALFTDKRILVLGTGTQWGKTSVGAIRMQKKMFQFTDPTDSFIITAPDYKTMMQSTLKAFFPLMEGYGVYDKKHELFRMNNGGICYFRTETDPDSIVGITNVRHVWGDEAGKYRLYFWENMQARADFLGGTIDLTTSPYALNWIWKELIKPFNAGKRNDIELVQAASWENPYHFLHDPVKRAEKQATMDERRFRMIYGGEFGRMEGLVYDCWDDDENYVDAFQLPTGTRYFGGVDWGYYPDPFVLKVRAVTPDGRQYGVSEFAKTRLTITDIVTVAKQKKETFGIEKFWADPSQPGHIEEFNRAGLSCEGADNDIRRGIDLHYELIKTRRYKEFRNTCLLSADERETYHYPEEKDLGPDDNSKEMKPVDQNNHAMDVDRYLTISLFRTGERKAPKVPNEERKKQESRSDYLKRLTRRSSNRHTENWS